MDGTVLKTEEFWQEAVLELLKERNIIFFTEVQKNMLKAFSGISSIVAAQKLKDEFQLSESIKVLADELRERAERRYLVAIEFVAGFEEFAYELKKNGIRLGLATNADIEGLGRLAKQMNLSRFFGDNMFSMVHAGNRPKPDPAVFLHTALALGIKPEECLVFEDSIFGIQAARAANMKVIAIKTLFNEDDRGHAHHAIEHYGEALSAIKKILEI